MRVKVFQKDLEIDEDLIKEDNELVRKQVREYLNGNKKAFSLSINFPKSFTGEVMKAIDNLKYGETTTYGQIATKLETAPIAVGQACGNNPLPIIVPCHRVLGKNNLGGYLGDEKGLEIKKKLLKLEKNNS